MAENTRSASMSLPRGTGQRVLVVDDAQRLASDRTITLHTTATATVDGDEDRLLRVLRNLVTNAVQHTSVGTPITVVVQPRHGQVELTVTDHGPGMPADIADKIFERFYRGDNSRNPETGGSGRGLSIVTSITEAHAGTVTVDTSPAKGTTFTVHLPTT